MELGLKNKTVLVTGSTAGIGFATALGFAREGANVLINGRSTERIEAAVHKIMTLVHGARVRGIEADLSTGAGAESITSQAVEVDILVNNAGVFQPQAFEEIPDTEWLRMFETNVMSGVRLSRYYFPRMIEKNWGRIIFVSSESALQIPVEMIHYGMTKTAQLAVARGLAERTRGTGVTVNSVLPGPTGSEGVGDFVAKLAAEQNLSAAEMERRFFETARPTSLLGRFARPEEVANLILYTASEAASATNGASLRVDGGVVRAI